MRIAMPDLTYSSDPKVVRENRDIINDYIKRYQGVIQALCGLHEANAGMCKHAAKRDVYDPGYAGGGNDGYKCDDCGKRGHF